MSNDHPYVNFRFSKKSREIHAYAWMEHAHKYIFWLNFTHSLQASAKQPAYASFWRKCGPNWQSRP